MPTRHLSLKVKHEPGQAPPAATAAPVSPDAPTGEQPGIHDTQMTPAVGLEVVEAVGELDEVSDAERAEEIEDVRAASKHDVLAVVDLFAGLAVQKRAGAAAKTGTLLEVDTIPDRLDLKDEHVKMAIDAGVKLVIDSDAHATAHFDILDLGVATARRGWATSKDVVNTLPVERFLKQLKRSHARRAS